LDDDLRTIQNFADVVFEIKNIRRLQDVGIKQVALSTNELTSKHLSEALRYTKHQLQNHTVSWAR
jgi:hypothetical protein